MSMRWQAALFAVVLAMATGYSRSGEVESLPFDYRDLVHVLLVDYLHSNTLPGAEQRYFVSVFGSDIDAALTARMRESGFDIRPASAWTPPDERNKNSRHISRVKIDVGDIKQVADDTYTVGIGYYCGPRCASSSTYKLQKDGNGWRVIDRQMRWIARAIGDFYDPAQPS